MKRNAVYTALLTIASLLIITAVLFTSLQFCMNQWDWYYKSYVKYNTDKQTMMSNEDMTAAIFRLVDYMEGRVDNIQLSVTEAGRVVEMYNRQEIDHMVDVRAHGAPCARIGAMLAYLNPSVKPLLCQLPVEGSLLAAKSLLTKIFQGGTSP